MDRRYFLHGVLGLSALPIAEAASASFAAEAQLPAWTRLAEDADPALKGRIREKITTLSSGLRDLDQLTNGLAPGAITVVAGRPAMGKSQLVFQIADHIARIQRRAVIITCAHDDAATVAKRLIAVRANVRADALIHGWRFDLDNPEREKDAQRRVHWAMSQDHTTPILLDDTHGLTVDQIANRASRFATERSVPLGAIIVEGTDVLVSGGKHHASNDLAAQLRSLSEDLGVPVIITVRVNRAVEERRDHRPRITDFNEPDATFVRAADLILTIYRDEIYAIDSPDTGLAELTLLRHRFGKLGTAKVRLGDGRFRDC